MPTSPDRDLGLGPEIQQDILVRGTPRRYHPDP
jgi:hypothetical protein